jgi:2-hydroxymuconate-semialdehyde hydrolase
VTTNSENVEIGRSIEINNITTNYHDLGSGDPVLLVHGSGAGVTAWANWRLTIPALQDQFRIIAPDLVGYGYSGVPTDGKYRMDIWVDQLIGLLDALSIDRAHVVGFSLGGGVALALAIRHPHRVAKIISIGGIGVKFELTEALDFAWGYTPSINNMRKMLEAFPYDKSLITDEIVNLRYQGSLRPGVQEAYAMMFPSPRQDSIDALSCTESDIANISQQTLLIHGREDCIVPYDQVALKIHGLIKSSELHVIGECGHWSTVEHTKKVNDLLSHFLGQ